MLCTNNRHTARLPLPEPNPPKPAEHQPEPRNEEPKKEPPKVETSPTRKTNPIFDVTIEDKIFSGGGDLPTRFWVLEGTSNGGCTLTPVDILLFLSITNLQSNDVIISAYNVELNNREYERFNMLTGKLFFVPARGQVPRVGATMNWQSGPVGSLSALPLKDADPSHAAPILGADILDLQLGGKYLGSKKTARGWALFQNPNQSVQLPIGNFLVKVGDQMGNTYQYKIPAKNPKANPNGDVLPRMTTIGPITDLSKCSLGREVKGQ
jgi:hypothetical protein